MKLSELWRHFKYREYRHMWTTERDQWFFAEMKTPDGKSVGYMPLSYARGPIHSDDPRVGRYIHEQMEKAGAKRLSYEEWTAGEVKYLAELRQKKAAQNLEHS